MRPRKQIAIPNEPSPFTAKNLKDIARDLASGKLKLPRVQISDDMVTGLRAMVNKSGLISFHAAYTIGGSRPLLKIGEMDKKSPEYISIEDARHLTKTIQALADKGIDVQEGLHRRLVRELRDQGTNWRPGK